MDGIVFVVWGEGEGTRIGMLVGVRVRALVRVSEGEGTCVGRG